MQTQILLAIEIEINVLRGQKNNQMRLYYYVSLFLFLLLFYFFLFCFPSDNYEQYFMTVYEHLSKKLVELREIEDILSILSPGHSVSMFLFS